MIKSNKTVDFKLKATDENGILVVIDDAADIQLPSIEKLTDTLKGAGILGEIDWPSYGQIGPMALTINNKADNPKYSVLSRPGEIKMEILWVNDTFDSGNASVGLNQNKVFITCFNKKYDPGKIEVGASSDGSGEYEVVYYRKLVNGREVLLIDKFNYRYAVNGKDYVQNVRTALE